MPLPASVVMAAARETCARKEFRETIVLLAELHAGGTETARTRLLEASAWMGQRDPDKALECLARAHDLDPADPDVHRAAIQVLSSRPATLAGLKLLQTILTMTVEPAIICRATDLVWPDKQAVGDIQFEDGLLKGWLATRGDRGPELQMSASGQVLTSEAIRYETPEKMGPWTFVRFSASWPSATPTLAAHDAAFGLPLRGSPLFNEAYPTPQDRAALGKLASRASTLGCLVVMPVYANYQAFTACIASLYEDETRLDRHIVFVDDASPDERIRRLLDMLSDRPDTTLLRNSANIGFSRSVNRALSICPRPDAVLLNADTLVPPGWLDRLHELGEMSGIGTLTPLSNNGDFTSVPIPFEGSPLGSLADVTAHNERLRQVPDGLIDLPTGIGFCLYITKAARAAVPLLDNAYGRGYLEDADYCLRVAEAGLRNVCATSVYVGHVGSASFGDQKRALVRRNAAILRRRWPHIDALTDAFIAADPLSPWRPLV